ncbi:uncharacterized protein PpBr36_10200 [Pyricularia pennisetigena]|uniref:uncharacterized protein n=1 Tax=Pyricularia pennisetigena TaxID=1578925 RepID=UPI00114DDE3B|nr:uncharacterized protein PpBr36_10200 [Pyricularia pennisetigena]TLS21373.1 hypothetical protein PpBr36_10200 [Pyricularia pennisetigena]
MAPTTTAATNGVPTGAVVGHQRRPTKTHVVPVLPLPLDRKHREQRQQREMRAAQAAAPSTPTATAHNHASALPRDAPAADSNARLQANGKTDCSPRRELPTATGQKNKDSGSTACENHSAVRQGMQTTITPRTSPLPVCRNFVSDQALSPASVPPAANAPPMPRQPLAANHFTNTMGAPPPPPHSATFPGFVPPPQMVDIHSRGKENIPPTSSGIMMPPQQLPFRPPPHQLHHPHPSEGSIMFGGFQDSNNTSPGPASAGMYPPPGIHFNEHPQAPNGHPHAWQPEHANDGGPVYPPAFAPNVIPSPSHSFQGSMSSQTAESGPNREENGHSHMPPPVMMNNGMANGHHMENHHAVLPVMPPNSTHPTPPRFISQIHQHEIQKYFEFNFNNPASADCQIVIRFSPDSDNNPWRVPVQLFGHRFILSISPALRAHLRQTGNDRDVAILFNDPYLRTDVMWDCLASLYGRPLSDIPEGDFARAAAFLATGCVLQLSSIIRKGVEDVMHSIQNWETLERAIELVFHGTTDFINDVSYLQPSHEIRYRHGPASHALMEFIVEWIIRHIPVNYSLDNTFQLPSYSRLPNVSMPTRQDMSPEETLAPTVQAPTKEKNPMLKMMKFGDLPLASSQPNREENGHSPASSVPSSSPIKVNAIISRILINLPFAMLKDIVAFKDAGNFDGLMTTPLRHQIFSQIIKERESRRLEVLEAIKAGKWTDASIKTRLASDGEDAGSQRWDVLGWKETYIFKDGASDIFRQWEPVRLH